MATDPQTPAAQQQRVSISGPPAAAREADREQSLVDKAAAARSAGNSHCTSQVDPGKAVHRYPAQL